MSTTSIVSLATTGWLVIALGSGGGATGSCPSANVTDVLHDPAVAAALDDAWRDSHEGAPDEHEEGGFVFQCQNGAGGYDTRIQRWPPGAVDHAAVPRGPESPEGCRTVASFHTHPGGIGGAHDDGYENEHPSDQDETFAHRYQIPGIIRYGEGGDPGATTTFSYGGTAPTTPSWSCPAPPVGVSTGDPHLRTFDGDHYDFQVAGDFVLVETDTAARNDAPRADDLAVHVRLEAVATSRLAGSHLLAQARSVAIRLGDHVIEVGSDGTYLDAVAATTDSLVSLRPADGGTIVVDDLGALRFTWPDGSVAIIGGPTSITIRLADSRAGTVRGLLGNDDGDPSDDLRTPGGTDAAADGELRDDRVTGAWADANRVPHDRSLFHAPAPPDDGPVGSTTDSVLLADDVRVSSTRVCADAGVTDPQLLLDCTLDVGASGDPRFAADAAATQRSLTALLGRTASSADLTLLAAAANGDATGLEHVLASGGADPDARRAADGATALMIAAQLGDPAMVDALLAAGADTAQRDNGGSTALLAAAGQGHVDVVRRLLDAGGDANAATSSGWTPLHAAAFAAHDDVVDALITAGAEVAAIDDRGMTPLVAAAQVGNTSTVTLLLDRGAAVDAATVTGWTALQWAAVNTHADTVTLLLQRGADVDHQAADGSTALHAAASANSVEIVQALLAAGADRTVKDASGARAIDLATRAGYTDLVAVLR